MNILTYTINKFGNGLSIAKLTRLIKGTREFAQIFSRDFLIEADEELDCFCLYSKTGGISNKITFNEFLREYCNLYYPITNKNFDIQEQMAEDKGLFNNFVSVNSQFIEINS